MRYKTWFSIGVLAGLIAAGRYSLKKRLQEEHPLRRALLAEQDQALLKRAAPLLRLPTSPGRMPEVLADGSGLRCALSGRTYPYRDGVLNLL